MFYRIGICYYIQMLNKLIKNKMRDYTPDQFYKTQDLSLDTKLKIINDAHSQCYEWSVDKLDCNESFARQRIEMSFEDIMEKFNDKAHFVVIHRKGHHHDRGYPDPGDGWNRWHLEVGFRVMSGIDYFLWVYVSEDKVEEFVNKYNLEKL